MNDRFKNPALWIGFLVAALMLVGHSPLLTAHPVAKELVNLAAEILGLAGTWFMNKGLAPPAAPAALLPLLFLAGCAGVEGLGGLLTALLVVLLLGGSVLYALVFMWQRPRPPGLGLLLILLPLACSSCAPGIGGYRQALKNGADVGVATLDSLQRINEDQEEALRARVKAAANLTELAETKAALATWRRQFDALRASAGAFGLTLTAAQGAVALADKGQRAGVDLDALIKQLVQESLEFSNRVRALVAGAGGAR